ncbi:hypothetical protein [Lactococcus garvieae]|uniref:hypothetical protein n=1 Tax=Lactococcus garvieae TaxID=1363 RepID=UPI00254E1D0C|nr:hypothetical protein [Lactococcus garvieae]
MNKQREKIDELLVEMPIYVRDYTRSKLVIPYSYVTLINYLRIFKRFFIWLLDNNYTKAIQIKDVKLKKGQEAVVHTENGLGRVRITHVTNSKDGYIYYTREGGKRLRTEVTQEVVMFYERDNPAN